MRYASVLLACSLICLASSSERCPEPRKPHPTSCTIFYNCVNLPEDGYVWVPSKCTEGLMFQPYLRMCVVPGEIWTCDTTELSPVKKHVIPELTDPTDTNYLGKDSLGFSETIDSSYAIDDLSNSAAETVTAYPSTEFEESSETRSDKSMENASCRKEENYLSEYTNSQGQLPLPLMQEYKDILDSHYKWLNELTSRLHVYNKELSAAIAGSLSIPVRDPTTVNPTQTIAIFASHNWGQNISLNYLVQSYTEGVELHNGDATETVGNNGPQVDVVATTPGSIVSTENALELLIDSLDSDNSIIRISDNLGNKQYLTIDRYKAAAHRLTSRTVSVVACTRNVRLPNRTDCNRYYTCEPKTAAVVEYSCPLHTAFNVYSRICDFESAKTCGGNKTPAKEIFIERAESKSATYEEAPEERLCREVGKMKDPASESHYYICYSTPEFEDVKSIRMTCPNALIFCQDKKVCTTRRLCDALP